MKRALAWLAMTLLITLAAACSDENSSRGPIVLAASSLQDALESAAVAWEEQGHDPPILSFAGTPALARQIEYGAPADMFVSADEAWMNELARKGLIDETSRKILARSRLVLIVPKGSDIEFDAAKTPIATMLGGGRLAMADPDTVPAGRYARQALTALGEWPTLENRITGSDNVRAALALVARGEAPLGIVYQSDAHAEPHVRVVMRFPEGSHQPITYPIALLKRSRNLDSQAFQAFLLSPKGQAILADQDFVPGAAR